VNKPFDVAMSMVGAVGFLVVGWFWSLSTWHHGFDMGWLVVAFIVMRSISARWAQGELRAKDYLAAAGPALPAFILEGLSDLSLRQFSVNGKPHQIILFSVFSCLFLIVVVAETALLRFGLGIDELSSEDYSMLSSAIRVLALAVSVSASLGTLILFLEPTHDMHTRLASLQSWFYDVSLLVYFIVILKTMLPRGCASVPSNRLGLVETVGD